MKGMYMKRFNKIGLHFFSWIIIPLVVLYFKWAAQDTTSLPGIPVPETESFVEVIKNNLDVIIVSLLGSIPVFYWSLFCLTPKLLFKTNYIKVLLYTAGLIAYYFVVSFITDIIFPMCYFFGTPYVIKVLAPIILLSAISGTLFAFKERLNHQN